VPESKAAQILRPLLVTNLDAFKDQGGNMLKLRLLSTIIATIMASGSVIAQDQEIDEEIVVQGVRSAEINALEEERKKDIFSSVISQDDAGNFADQNVAESLQRLPGVTLQKSEGEGKFVTVRGLGPGFVTVHMDGAEVASGGGGFEAGADSTDNRGFALDAIPADLLGSIEVLKSLTPDMDLNSIGGTINVKTVSAFNKNRDTLKVTTQASMQDYRVSTLARNAAGLRGDAR
jgi:TonB-dependent receptor